MKEVEAAELPPRRSFYHPLSGVAILAIDWVFFGLEWELGPISVALSSLAAFASSYAIVRRVQERWAGDEPKKAHVKALLGATAAGVPFAIGGTVVGGLILALSGLRARGIARWGRSRAAEPPR